MRVTMRPSNDNANVQAITYGPVVLSGNYGSTTLSSLPRLDVGSISRTSSTALTFTASANGSTVNLIPFYDAHGHNYTVYWYASTAPSGYVKLVNRHSGKVVGVSGGSTADGAAIVQQTDTGAASQRWQIVDVGGGYVKVVNRNSGKVLDVASASTADGARVIQYGDRGGANQQWRVVTSGGYTKLVNRNSGKVLDVYQRSTVDGAAVVQWTDNGGPNQQWTMPV